MANKYLNEVVKRAREVANGCPLMDGRDKIDAGDHVNEVFTIADAFKLTGDNGAYYCVVVDEIPNGFFLSGGALTSIIEQAEIVADAHGVSLSETVEGIQFKFGDKVKTKNNRDFRPVTVVN